MPHPLDKPIWSALTTRQREFAVGEPPALRFRPDVEPFIAAADDSPASLAALRDLMQPGEELIMLKAHASPLPDGVECLSERAAVQMIADRADCIEPSEGIVALGPEDSTEMQALADLTEPGPFRSETHRLGSFWGIRHDGRLVAMAGERLKMPGLTELSGVCCHPDARGLGYGRLLSRLVMARIARFGDKPFLHAYADNQAAIDLYGSLGFELRSQMAVQVIRRTG